MVLFYFYLFKRNWSVRCLMAGVVEACPQLIQQCINFDLLANKAFKASTPLGRPTEIFSHSVLLALFLFIWFALNHFRFSMRNGLLLHSEALSFRAIVFTTAVDQTEGMSSRRFLLVLHKESIQAICVGCQGGLMLFLRNLRLQVSWMVRYFSLGSGGLSREVCID